MSNKASIHCKMMTITPAMAMDWLEKVNNRNRPVSQSHVNVLARDMKDGKWGISHEGIAFDPNGILLDGQHRLWAIVEADTPIETLVFFNVPEEAIMIINGGRVRTLVDHLKLANRDGYLTSHHTSTLKAMLGGAGVQPKLSHQETSEILKKHREAVDFAVKYLSHCRTKGICNAITRSVIARAWYSADHNDLIRFCELLTSGIISNFPSAAALVSLREYLTTNTGGTSGAIRREKYGRIERALKAFLKRESIGKLVPSTKELFPLPQDEKACA